MAMRFTRFFATFLVSVALAATASTAAAQIPEKFNNLKVLPQDISKDQLVEVMRSFSSALGVRCHYCHVGSATGDLREMHFSADDKKEKQIARVMMGMVSEINGTLIPKTGIENPVRVRCATCHRGVTEPEPIDDIAKEAFQAGGVDSVKTKYAALKEKYYGADSYNFKPGPLNAVAEWLSEEKKDNDAAIAIMKFNIEQNPGVGYCWNLLGRIQAEAGKKEEAIASLKKAIELDPEDRWSPGLLKKLQEGK